MAGIFDFFGLPQEIRAMIYQKTFNAAIDGDAHIFVACSGAEDDFRFERLPQLALRQLCRATHDEYDEDFACKATLAILTAHALPNEVANLTSMLQLPKLLFKNIRDLKLAVYVEDDIPDKSHDFTWLSKFSKLRSLDIAAVKATTAVTFSPAC